MGKVILIGGLPMVGKSTVASLIASRLNAAHISTDDIGEAVCAFCGIDRMRGLGHPAYYEKTSPQDMLSDLLDFRRTLAPSLKRLAEIHSSWGRSAVIEGYMISPDCVPDSVGAVYLSATDELLRVRITSSAAFREASDDAKENYLARTLLYRTVIENEWRKHGTFLICLEGTESPDEIVEYILSHCTFGK